MVHIPLPYLNIGKKKAELQQPQLDLGALATKEDLLLILNHLDTQEKRSYWLSLSPKKKKQFILYLRKQREKRLGKTKKK